MRITIGAITTNSRTDKSRKACALIEDNLDFLSVPEDETEIVCLPAETFTARKYETGWDIVFFDPPYSSDYFQVLAGVGNAENRVLNENGILVVEHHSKNRMPDEAGQIRRWRILKQGETSLSFYENN